MHGASNRHAHRQVHLILHGNHDGCDMFRSIADDWKENKTDEGFRDMGGFDKGIDGINEILGADSNSNCDDHENEGSSPRSHLWLLRIVVFGSLLSIEKIGMGTKLEDEIEHVEYKKDYGGAV